MVHLLHTTQNWSFHVAVFAKDGKEIYQELLCTRAQTLSLFNRVFNDVPVAALLFFNSLLTVTVDGTENLSIVVLMLQVLMRVYFTFRLDEVEDAVDINGKLNQTVKNRDEKIASLETRSLQ